MILKILPGIYILLASWTIAGLLLIAFKKFFGKHLSVSHNEVSAVIFATVGLLQSLILAFVVIAVWEDYEQTNENVSNEASHLNTLFAFSLEIEDELGGPIRTDVLNYANSVVNDEWKKLDENMAGDSAAYYAHVLREKVFHLSKSNTAHMTIVEKMIETTVGFAELRRQRIEDMHSKLPGIVWFVMIAGSIICLLSSFLLQVDNRNFHWASTMMLTTIIALVMYVSFELDAPFNGLSKIGAGPFEWVIKHNSKPA